jgi:SWI/SNF-related matrix-associated actin-dependent regulator of chromatin subfamily D
MPHLSPLPPLQLPYTIRVDPAYNTPPDTVQSSSNSPSSDSSPRFLQSHYTIYDVLVPIEDPLTGLYLRATQSQNHLSTLTELAALDENLATTIQAIANEHIKHSFFTDLSNDPVRFIKKWVASQQRDLEMLLGEAPRGGGEEAQGEEWRRGGSKGVWGAPATKQSVGLWLARPRH